MKLRAKLDKERSKKAHHPKPDESTPKHSTQDTGVAQKQTGDHIELKWFPDTRRWK
jgi:hypothetical protein